jgi:thiosulfate/3-mercaptopyruvate sulfurtransferase
LVLDVREAYRYLGESEPIDSVAGHIPGAANCPFLENLDSDGRFLAPFQLREKYNPWLQGRSPADLIVHCGSGVTACHTLLALEVAGLHGARLYVGSWSQWSRNQKPIATGS